MTLSAHDANDETKGFINDGYWHTYEITTSGLGKYEALIFKYYHFWGEMVITDLEISYAK